MVPSTNATEELERVRREHARAFAAVPEYVREEARQFADDLLKEWGWISDPPTFTKSLPEEDFEDFLKRTEEPGLESEDEYNPCGMGIVKLNRKQKSPLMEECLQGDCDCHKVLPDYSARCSESSKQEPSGLNVVGMPGPSVPCHASQPMPSSSARVLEDTTYTGPVPGPSCRPSQINTSEDTIPRQSVQDSSLTAQQPSTAALPSPSFQSPVESNDQAIPCRWRQRFGGCCEYTAITPQTHDRHVCTHLPDDNGFQIALFRCTICSAEFTRDYSVRRHVKDVHKEPYTPSHCGTPLRPWWWPVDLLLSQRYRNETRAERPSNVGSTWEERMRAVIASHPTVVNKPFQASRSQSPEDISPERSRPTKRRRTGRR